ncbi:MAG: exopolysaccharide biosynthesis polyprenyl glycosylphosphotransferase [bacterium]
MQHKATLRSWLWFGLDGLLWVSTFLVAQWLRWSRHIPTVEWDLFWRFVPLSAALIMISFYLNGVYRDSLENDWAWTDLWWGWLYGISGCFGLLFLLKIPFSRQVFFTGSLLFLGTSVLLRAVEHKIVQTIQSRSTNKPTMALVGFNRDDEVNDKQTLVPDSFDTERIDRAEENDLMDKFVHLEPDFILVNGAEVTLEKIRELFEFGSRANIPVRCYPNSEQIFLSESSLESWKDHMVLRSELHHKMYQQLALKSVFDFVVGGLLTLVFLPVLICIALLIAVIDGLPVFYSQTRVGQLEETFEMYKFRTMETGAEKTGPDLTTGPDDPRITALGRFLRRWSLDELPQLLNILKGEMSLVGPRPEIPSITKDYDREERRVLWLKPGLTGLSQVSGREQLELEEKLKIDQYYLTEYSMFLDFWIMLKTVFVVVQGKGYN